MGGGGKGGSQTVTNKVELPKSLEKASQEILAAGMRSAALPYSPNRGMTIAAFTPQQQAAFQGAASAASAFGLPTSYQPGNPTPQTNSMGIQGYSTGGLYDEMRNATFTPENEAARSALLQSYAASAQGIKPHAQADAAIAAAAGQPQGPPNNPPYVAPAAGGSGGAVGGAGGTGAVVPRQGTGKKKQSAAKQTAGLLAAMNSGDTDAIKKYAKKQQRATRKARKAGDFGSGEAGGQGSMEGVMAAAQRGGGGGLFGGYTGLADMVNGGGPGQRGDRFQGGGMVSRVGNAVASPVGGSK